MIDPNIDYLFCVDCATSEATLTGGCKHEHVNTCKVCDFHRKDLLKVGAYCKDCFYEDGHECEVTFR